MKKALVIGAAALALAGAACSGELKGYDGQTVDQAVDAMYAAIGSEACEAVDIVGYETAKALYLGTEPQIGSDEFEGEVFDGWYERAC